MIRFRSLFLASVVLAGIGWLSSCGDGATEPPLQERPRATTLTVTPAMAELSALGETAQLSAEVRDQNGNVVSGATVSWSSSAADVVTVDGSGLVTAVGNGTATISAAAGSASGAATVTVMQSADSVAVSPAEATLAALGDTLRLAAEAFDANGHAVEGAEFGWSSSNGAIATVNASGRVRAVAEGMATITAITGGASGTSEITVENPDRAALVALYSATDGPNWTNNENWLTDRPLRQWYGVFASSGRVRRLDLRENNLSGQISPEIGKLTSLSQLTLDRNALTGPIPPELGMLVDMEGLALQHNNLDAGPIPVEFANLVNLQRLRLDPQHCAPTELKSWLRERRLDVLPCIDPGGRLLPSALLREDSRGLSLALDDDLHDPMSTTVSDHAVVTASVQGGWLVLAPRGIGVAEVEIVPAGGGATATATVEVREAVGTFGIDIVMDQPATALYAETIAAAADWWSSALNGTEWEGRDAREYCDYWERNVPVAAKGNDLVIWARRETDPSYTAGASAWSCRRREGPATEPSHYYPVAGIVTSNARVPNVFGSLFYMRHELGHVLGLTAAFPPATGLVTEDYKYFIGSKAVAAFREGGGDANLPGIPMNGPHWIGAVSPELMIGSSRDGRTPDKLSVAALSDAGYTVDMSVTTPWSSGASAVGSAPVNDVVVVRRR